jgi:large subunit ribosomal protein L21
MFAVIKTGGKQYKVKPDDILMVEKLSATPNTTFQFKEVLMVEQEKGTTIGNPFVNGAVVEALVVDQIRGEKLIIFKKRRRHTYRRKRGHRQDLTVVKITAIQSAS